MDIETFNSLKPSDRVLCNYGSEATVLKLGEKSVKLKCDKPKSGWCPYFFRHELKCKL